MKMMWGLLTLSSSSSRPGRAASWAERARRTSGIRCWTDSPTFLMSKVMSVKWGVRSGGYGLAPHGTEYAPDGPRPRVEVPVQRKRVRRP